jgi:hypothetical protein
MPSQRIAVMLLKAGRLHGNHHGVREHAALRIEHHAVNLGGVVRRPPARAIRVMIARTTAKIFIAMGCCVRRERYPTDRGPR